MLFRDNKKEKLMGLGSFDFDENRVDYTNVYYVSTGASFFFNKTRRFFVARTKRLLKRIKTVTHVWVKLGRLIYFFKKAVNSRMGGGDGSFYSVRRLFLSGSVLAKYSSKRHGFKSLALRHLLSKLKVNVKVVTDNIRKVVRYLKKHGLAKFAWERRIIRPRNQLEYDRKNEGFLWNMHNYLNKEMVVKILSARRFRKRRNKLWLMNPKRKLLKRRTFRIRSYSVIFDLMGDSLNYFKMLKTLFTLNLLLVLVLLKLFIGDIDILTIVASFELLWASVMVIIMIISVFLSKISLIYFTIVLLCVSTIELVFCVSILFRLFKKNIIIWLS